MNLRNMNAVVKPLAQRKKWKPTTRSITVNVAAASSQTTLKSKTKNSSIFYTSIEFLPQAYQNMIPIPFFSLISSFGLAMTLPSSAL
ncbi:MAG: hypothetical protein ACLFU9_00385 [Candidatus Bathyarchaeia archaeon]